MESEVFAATEIDVSEFRPVPSIDAKTARSSNPDLSLPPSKEHSKYSRSPVPREMTIDMTEFPSYLELR